MNKLNLRTKSLFLAGMILLVTAGGVWVINGGIGRISGARAETPAGGDFTETWTATEMHGMARCWPKAGGWVNYNSSTFAVASFPRIESTDIHVESGGGGITNELPNYGINPVYADGTPNQVCRVANDANSSNTITKWTVTGHIY